MPEEQAQIEIIVSDPKKIGDGMNAYMVYKVATKVNKFSFLVYLFKLKLVFEYFYMLVGLLRYVSKSVLYPRHLEHTTDISSAREFC